MKTMCPPGYHHNGFVATHALGHMCTSCVHINITVQPYIFKWLKELIKYIWKIVA